MDRAVVLEHLRVAEQHIAQGEKRIAHQEKLVAELDRDGHDAKDARAILSTLRNTPAVFVQDRNRIVREL